MILRSLTFSMALAALCGTPHAIAEDVAAGSSVIMAQAGSDDGEAPLIPDDALPKIPELENQPDEGTGDEKPSMEAPEDAVTPEERSPSSGAAEKKFGDGPLPEVMYDPAKLPEPVRRMRELILAAAKTGDIERLRDLIGLGDTMTTLSFGGLEGDPIEFLRESSGDKNGFEILAILIEVLESGYVQLDAGTENEIYAWPYFFAWPLDRLSPEQRVEMFRVLTAGDVEDSENFGGYVFYRVGIKPDGTWHFFVAGD